MAEFAFGVEFQNKMLALMLSDLSFAVKVARYIPEERFHSDAHKYLFNQVKLKVATGDLPSFLEVEDDMKKIEPHRRRLYKTFVKSIFDLVIPPGDIEFLKNKLTMYSKKNAFIEIFQTAQTLWNAKKHDDAFTYTLEGIGDLFGISFSDDAIVPIERFEEERMIHVFKSETHTRRIPTNIGPLDDILSGGLERGELGILLAQPKRGKSIGLVHMGCSALTMRSGRVAHFVLEGTTEQTILRYQSRLSGIQYSRLDRDEITTEESRLLTEIGAKYISKLQLVPFNQHWEYTVKDIESTIKELARAGKKPDLVIVDYGDLLKSHEKRESFRLEQTEVYRDLKKLAMIQNVALWTAAQAQRPSEDPDKVYLLRAKDIAEAFEKVRIADLVITLNQTPREKDLGILRFHVDIYRSSDADRTIRLITNFEKMIFYSKLLGHIDKGDIPSWMKK